jgi:hypothetical protein
MTKKSKSITEPKVSRPRSKRARIAPLPTPSDAALVLNARASSRAKDRRTTVRHAFIGAGWHVGEPPADDPPLARLLRASKGGNIRLKLCLAVLWQAGGGDERHSVEWPARTWAALLDLPDPEQRGDRRIRDAIRALERAELLVADRQPGRPIRLILRRDDGTGEPYTNPGQAARATKEAGAFDPTDLYVQLPSAFWTAGWAIVLSTPGLAMLLVMLMLTSNGAEERVWINPSQARARFGLSEDSWSRGVAELRRHRILEIQKKPVSEDFGWRRIRNTYTLKPTRLEESPGEPEDAPRGMTATRRRPDTGAKG